VIVGPNGSGKSNLVDAISWVLGEQGPRALRGTQMADVIFAGSPSRPALGMAEVKLVIDNSSGLIPVPLTEIEISRAIFRSGESEYRIGGPAVRLLDIQELLAETGIGRALHTVVGQGQLDDVLTARPEERRQYIEEAAGISKHKRRKERAQRKLAGLEQDLLRLQDVLGELRRQLKPLKQQAEVARRHEAFTAEAAELAWKVQAARLRTLLADRDRRMAGWEEGLAKRREAKARIGELDAGMAELDAARRAAADRLAGADARLREAQAARSTAEAALRGSVEAEADARSRLAAESARTARLDQLDEEVRRLQAAIEETSSALVERERDLEAAEREFREAERVRREVEDERRRLAEEAIAYRAEVETLRRSLDAYERERERLESGLAEIRDRIRAAEAEHEVLEAEVERLDAGSTPLTDRHHALEAERHALAAEVAGLEEALREHEGRRELLEARGRDLRETPGSRFLEGHAGRAVGLLRDLVRAEPGLERALAAALGALADAVIYEALDRALADAPSADGATLALTAEPPAPVKVPGERPLLDAVTADDRVRGLVATLFRRVYLAADVAEAARKHRDHPGASFVTPAGVLVGPLVIRTAAETDARAEAVKRELAAAAHEVAAVRSALKPKRARLDAVRAEGAEVGEAIARIDADITAAADRMAGISTELASARKEEEVLTERLSALEDAATAWRAGLAAHAEQPAQPEPPSLPSVPEHPVGHRVEVETLRRDRARLEAALERVQRERRMLAADDPEVLRAALFRAEADRAAAEARLRDAEEALAAATAEREEVASADREAADREAEANTGWRDAAALLERLREEYEQEDRLRADIERRIGEAERLLRDGHGKDPAEALSALEPDATPESLEKRAELVGRRLALLGRVNLLAGGEYEALQERHDFLARELDDVRKARRDLLEVVEEVDREIVSLFDAAFADVAAAFSGLFGELFPGGEGKLTLTDPGDLLATGIEVEARPGRKRVKRISLLSGGERALTALAYLFAIFRARPSPFYLLDEVEPALDDVNLGRFIQLVKGFAETSQVLVVSHQKRTMEAADILYGVSMSRDGSSTVISQRFERDEEAGRGDRVVRVPEADTVR
ncbi:MAG: AAA family ATPase, partial [Actinobacteria bacterium]|nr:AAA family ATPase [Actinomycetota bacterium]